MTDKIPAANTSYEQLDREQLIEAIAEWQATPESLRKEQSLNQLAVRLNVAPGGRFYELASSIEVYHRMLVKVAGDALQMAPDILYRLAEDAKAGKTRAAEIYLDFVRKTITDDKFIERMPQSKPELRTIMTELQPKAEALLKFAESLGNAPPPRFTQVSEHGEHCDVSD